MRRSPDAGSDWRPTASREALELRARTVGAIRAFFEARNVLEVETPALSHAAVTDLHLHSMAVPCAAAGGELFLQTSPEYAMKRLLAAGSGDIFQICKSFRDAERGARHNPEFTMLEWYRLGFDHHRLMDEVQELFEAVAAAAGAPPRPATRWRYRDLFREHLGIDPISCALEELRRAAGADGEALGDDRDDLLALLLTRDVEPALPPDQLVFVHGYPASQAALARLEEDEEGDTVASRFEAYLGGLELANGFYELTDAREQEERFHADNRARSAQGLPTVEPDRRLLEALAHGLPDCAGVAVGVDRLVMAVSGLRSLDAVLAFPLERA